MCQQVSGLHPFAWLRAGKKKKEKKGTLPASLVTAGDENQREGSGAGGTTSCEAMVLLPVSVGHGQCRPPGAAGQAHQVPADQPRCAQAEGREGGARTACLESAAWTQCHPHRLPPTPQAYSTCTRSSGPRWTRPCTCRRPQTRPRRMRASARRSSGAQSCQAAKRELGPPYGRLVAVAQVKRIICWCVKGDRLTGSGRGPVTSGLFLPRFLGWFLQLWPAESEGGVGASARAFWRA